MKRSVLRCLFLLPALTLFVMSAATDHLCAWADTAPRRRVVLVVVPGLAADDLPRPELASLAILRREGGAGWMVCRAANTPSLGQRQPDGRDTTAALLLTLNAGSRAAAPSDTFLCVGEPGTSDRSALPADALEALSHTNGRLDHSVALGALGDLVHARQLMTATLADSDGGSEECDSLLAGMDSKGEIDFAGPRLTRILSDENAPYGVRPDPAAMLKDYDGLPSNVGLTVLIWHDLDRADRYAPLCLPEMAKRQRSAAMQRLNALLEGLRQRLGEAEGNHGRNGGEHSAEAVSRLSPVEAVRLILLAPGPPTFAARQDRLAPILIWGTGIAPGVLGSASTRRSGLVVNTDLLPTLAEFFGSPLPKGAIGRPIFSATAESGSALTPASWREAHTRLLNTAELQNVFGGLPTVQLLLVVASALSLAKRRSVRLICALAAAIVALPLGMLILPPLAAGSVWLGGTLLGIFAVIAAGIGAYSACNGARGGELAVVAFSAALVVIALADLLTGMRLLRDAWMNSSVVEGARYYGIGNEYMGALIGAGLVLLPALTRPGRWQYGRIVALCGLYMALLVAMGLPSLGAKVGAIPSAGCAFGVALLVWRREKLRGRDIIGILLGAALLLGGFALWDLRHSGTQQSHLARAFSGNGGGSLASIGRRKLMLEGYLLLHSPWSATLLIAAAALWWLWRSAPRSGRETLAVSAGILTGSVACLLFNDSGVTAAALTLLYGWTLNSVVSSPWSEQAAPREEGS